MRRLLYLFIISNICFSCNIKTEQIVSLAGSWMVKLDPEDSFEVSRFGDQDFDRKIQLPGTSDEAKLGNKTVDTAYGILSREYEYIGPAWYRKEITIPKAWEGKEIRLFLERVLWESRVYVDGEFISMQDALGTPHVHELGVLEPGNHIIDIRVNNDMIHNIGDKGHAYGEYMQSIWNGIVGKIELRALDRTHINKLRLFPDPEEGSLRVEMEVSKPAGKEIEYLFRVREKGDRKIIYEEPMTSREEEISINLKIERKITQWNEFNPFLYQLEVVIDPVKRLDVHYTSFGFVEVSKSDHHILINNEKVFLRGNLDCIHFPKTGYPSMDVEEWIKIFRTYKRYGLNHVRFHSWCPPEAAFEAADEVGIYIQAEASVWIDWWMGTDMVSRGRPEMDTKGHPQGIGRGDEEADNFIRDEMQRMIDTYGNHPSFIMFCIGNELGSSDFELMGKWINELKNYDPRRLYAASAARTITPYCDYSATHNVPGIGGVRQRMFSNTNWDYEDRYSRALVPIIAHEVGQWPVYPDWKEIDKYTGVLKPRNLEQLEKIAIETGLWNQNEELTNASGKLSALLYKDEIESFMRTPSCAGYQLLSMQDYIGQGEALIGWLNSFYESKGTLKPEDARQYMNCVVPLAEFASYCWTAGDEMHVVVLLHQYGPVDLKDQSISCQLKDDRGNIKYSELIKETDYPKGELHEAAELVIPLPEIEDAGTFKLSLEVDGTLYQNSWQIWVYPKELVKDNSDIIISHEIDSAMLEKLGNGSSVLLIADKLGDPDYQINAAFKPLYWSASFFPGQSIETLGAIVNNQHPALSDFPTEDFASWNFWNLCDGAKAIDLSDTPGDLKPIIQPVSDFHFSKKLGSIFEAKVGKGKLMVCGYDISDDRDSLPEVKQLRYSLLKYMSSNDFKPDAALSNEDLRNLFPGISLSDKKSSSEYRGAGYNEAKK